MQQLSPRRTRLRRRRPVDAARVQLYAVYTTSTHENRSTRRTTEPFDDGSHGARQRSCRLWPRQAPSTENTRPYPALLTHMCPPFLFELQLTVAAGSRVAEPTPTWPVPDVTGGRTPESDWRIRAAGEPRREGYGRGRDGCDCRRCRSSNVRHTVYIYIYTYVRTYVRTYMRVTSCTAAGLPAPALCAADGCRFARRLQLLTPRHDDSCLCVYLSEMKLHWLFGRPGNRFGSTVAVVVTDGQLESSHRRLGATPIFVAVPS